MNQFSQNDKNFSHNSSDSFSEWVPLSKLSIGTPYSAEYLSLLARRRKLSAKKVNDVWYSSKEALDDYVSKIGGKALADTRADELLPLSKLSADTPYSTEYLSLLARKRKLSATKIDGVWCATKKEVAEYVAKQGSRKETPLLPEAEKILLQTLNVREEKVLLKKPSVPTALKKAYRSYADIAGEAMAFVPKVPATLFWNKALVSALFLVLMFNLVGSLYSSLSGRSLSSDLRSKLEIATGQTAVTASAFEAVENSLEFLTSGFSNLRDLALGKFKSVAKILPAAQTAPAPVITQELPPPPIVQSAITQTTPTYSYESLRSDLKTELESYVRAQLSTASPVNVYQNYYNPILREEILLADTRPTVTRQSTADVDLLSRAVSRLTDGGNFINATLSGSLSGTGDFSILTFTNATGTSATTTNFYSTNASSTNIFANIASIGTLSIGNLFTNSSTTLQDFTAVNSTTTSATTTNFYVSGRASTTELRANSSIFGNLTSGLGTFTNLLVNGSSTLQNFTFSNATGTSATTTNFYSANASSTNFYANISGIGSLTVNSLSSTNATSSTFAITGNGSGLTFYGTGNHDITAQSGTLRIGSNTIIGNIEALDNTVDIGTPGTRFDKIYATEVNATTLVGTIVGGNVSAETLTINSDNVSADVEDSYLTFERGTGSPNAVFQWDSTNDRFVMNSDLFITPGTGAGAFLVHGSTTLQNLTFQNATGTNATTTNLYVSGLASTTALRANTAYFGGNVGIGTTTSWGSLSVTNDGSRPSFVVEDTTSPDSTPFIIDSAGNVGIGSASPTNKLQITGGHVFLENGRELRGGTSDSVFGYIRLYDSSDGKLYIQGRNTNSIILQENGGYVGIGTTTPPALLSLNDPAGVNSFYIGSSTPKFIVKDSGNVGIGTASPSGRLTLASGSTAAEGICFGDCNTVLYKSSNGIVKTDNTLSVNGTYITQSGFTDGGGYGTSIINNVLTLYSAGKVTGSATGDWQFNDGSVNTVMFKAGGNVGIGTTNPQWPLNVYNNSGTTNPIALLEQASTGDAGLSFYLTGGAQVTMGIDNSDSDKFKIARSGTLGSTDQLVIDSTGNLGIGTSSPSYKLSVSGDGFFDGGTVRASTLVATSSLVTPLLTSTNLLVNGSTTLQNFTFQNATGTAATTTNLYVSGRASTTELRSNTAYFSGRVGVATTSPKGLLDIGGTTLDYNHRLGIKLSNDADASTGLLIERALNDTSLWMGYNTLADGFQIAASYGTTGAYKPITFYTSSAERLRIAANGNVGIGTTNPGAKFQLTGDSSSDTNAAGILLNDTRAVSGKDWILRSEAGDLVFRDSTATANRWVMTGNGHLVAGTDNSYDFGGSGATRPRTGYFGTSIVAPTVRADTYNNQANTANIILRSGSATQVGNGALMTILDSGNVGIGTTTPYTAKLHVDTPSTGASTTVRITAGSTIANRNFLELKASAADLSTSLASVINAGSEVGSGTRQLAFQIHGTERMRINSNGDVGIGTTDPAVYHPAGTARGLHVSNSGPTSLRLQDTSDTNEYFDIGVSSTAGEASLGTYYSTLQNIDIDAYGYMHFDIRGQERMRVASTGNVGIGTSTPYAKLSVTGIVTDTNPALFAVASTTGGTSTSTHFVVLNSGNVGIGTTNPTNKLHVEAGSTSVGGITINGTSEPALSFSNGGTAKAYFGLATQNNGFGGVGSSLVNDVVLRTDDGTNGNIRFMTQSGTTQMSILRGGNVGIGTTNPGAKLEISGAAQLATQFAIGYNNGGGIGGANLINIGVTSWPSNSGTSEYGISGNNITFNSSATTEMAGISFGLATPNSVFTTSDVTGLAVNGINKGASHTITRAWGISVNDLTSGSNNALLFLGGGSNLGTTFTGNWAIYNNTSKNSYLGSGNIGLGTTDPSSLLDVFGGAGTQATGIHLKGGGVHGSVTDAASMNIWTNGSTGSFITFGDGSGYDIHFGRSSDSGATKYLTIRDSGFVGIGTTTPPHQLTIASSTGPQLTLTDGVAGSNPFSFRQVGSALYIATSSQTSFATSSNNILTLNGVTGNVGIGSSTPYMKLVVSNHVSDNTAIVESTNGIGSLEIKSQSTASILKINRSDTSAGSQIYLQTAGANNWGIGNSIGRSTTDLQFYNYAGAEALTITSSGSRVGVATTTPNNMLDIYSTSKSAIGFSGASGSTYKWTIGMDVSNGGRFSIASSTALGTTDRFVIDGDGDVGIGTTNPGYILDVQSTAPVVNLQATTGTNAAYHKITNTGGSLYLGTESSAGGVIISGSTLYSGILGTSGARPLQLATNNAVAMTILSGGNVGIGTTTPQSTLHTKGSGCISDANYSCTTTSGALSVQNIISWGAGNTADIGRLTTVGGESAMVRAESGWALDLAANANSTAHLRITGAGNIGIGSTSPMTLLAVAGTSTLQDILPSGTMTNNLSIYSIGSSTSRWNSVWANTFNVGTSTWSLTAASTTGRFSIFDTANGAGAERLSITAAGNLGIGTSSAKNKLDVYAGNISLHGASNNAGGILFTRGAAITPSLADNSHMVIYMEHNGGLAGNDEAMVFDGLTTEYDYRFKTTDIDRLVISGTGNVGIGTTNPSNKLHVAGGITATSTIAITSTGYAITMGDTGVTSNWALLTNNGGAKRFRIYDTDNARDTLQIDGSGNITFSNYTAGNCCSDLAEYYPSSEAVEPALILSVDENNSTTVRKARSQNDTLIGVVSTNPAIAIEENNFKIAGGVENYVHDPMKPVVALAGRVPVKVTNENGSISKGDRITVSSTTPGYGMKLTGSGQSVGIAMDDFNGIIGDVVVFVNLEHYTDTESDWSLMGITDFKLSVYFEKIWSATLEKFADATNGIQKLFAKEVHTEKLCMKKSDGSDICVTGDELQAFVLQSGSSSSTTYSPIVVEDNSSGTGSGTSTTTETTTNESGGTSTTTSTTTEEGSNTESPIDAGGNTSPVVETEPALGQESEAILEPTVAPTTEEVASSPEPLPAESPAPETQS